MTRLVVLLSASALLAAAPAAAQQGPATRSERPYRGLFGGGVGDFQQLLSLNMSLGGGYSHTVVTSPAIDGVEVPTKTHNGGFGNISGQLAYGLNRTRVGVNASVGASGWYHAAGARDFNASYSGGVAMFVQPAQATRLTASHFTTYLPFVTLNLLQDPYQLSGEQPISAGFAGQEFGVIQTKFLNHWSAASLTQNIFRRVALTAFYTRQSSDVGGTKRVFSGYGGGTGVGFQLARGLNLRVGYSYTKALADENGDQSYQGHNIDGGIEFNRAISFSRRTTLAFGTGASAISNGNRREYRMTGHVRLNHEIGRTWYASAGYARSTGFLETLSTPVVSDSVTLGFGGLVNRRVAFHSGAVASSGEFAFGGGGRAFDSYRGSAGLTFGLTRHLGLGTNYSYYRYWFGHGALLPTGLSRQLDGHSVRVHLSLWVPLVHRARRPDATR